MKLIREILEQIRKSREDLTIDPFLWLVIKLSLQLAVQVEPVTDKELCSFLGYFGREEVD